MGKGKEEKDKVKKERKRVRVEKYLKPFICSGCREQYAPGEIYKMSEPGQSFVCPACRGAIKSKVKDRRDTDGKVVRHTMQSRPPVRGE